MHLAHSSAIFDKWDALLVEIRIYAFLQDIQKDSGCPGGPVAAHSVIVRSAITGQKIAELTGVVTKAAHDEFMSVVLVSDQIQPTGGNMIHEDLPQVSVARLREKPCGLSLVMRTSTGDRAAFIIRLDRRRPTHARRLQRERIQSEYPDSGPRRRDPDIRLGIGAPPI